MEQVFKVGIDIHGVIDTFPEKFKFLAAALAKDGAEVHIITGTKRNDRIEKLLSDAGIIFTHYFSIVDELETASTVDWVDGLPYADEREWNTAKRNYCDKVGIDFMIDDSAVYRDTFVGIETTFLHLAN